MSRHRAAATAAAVPNLHTLQVVPGEKYTPQVQEAWASTIDALLAIMPHGNAS